MSKRYQQAVSAWPDVPLYLHRGTITSGTHTCNPRKAQIQELTNGGAFILDPPPRLSPTMRMILTNNASAGAVTISNFDNQLGDSIDTTDGNIFECLITNDGVKSTIQVTADTANT